MSEYRVQAITPGSTGMPDDVYVNTFHFSDLGANIGTAIFAPQAVVLLDEFYGADVPAIGGPLWALMPSSLGQVEYRVYDMGDPQPRPPVILPSSSPGGPNGANFSLPYEVALCSSYYADRNLPRQRGRIYWGPLTTLAAAASGTPATAAINGLVEASVRLHGSALANVTPWMVYSPTQEASPVGTTPAYNQITDGWVDNAFDTQRRRGPDATSRNNWAG